MFWNIYCMECDKIGKKPNKVASELGLSSATTTRWKSGAIPNGETLVRIAEYFHVSVDYLLGRTNQPTQMMGHINDDNSVQNIQDSPVITHQSMPEQKQDSVTREFIKVFEDLNFDDKVELMGLAVKMRKGV